MANAFPSLVILNFVFSNVEGVPPSIHRVGSRSREDWDKWGNNINGVLRIHPTEKCSLKEFLPELTCSRYTLVDALYMEQINTVSTEQYLVVHRLRYVFSFQNTVNPRKEFKKMRGMALEHLKTVCENLWRIRVVARPFFSEGVPVPYEHVLDINMDKRLPILLPDGKPRTQWKKDQNGIRIGREPVPIRPEYMLHFDQRGPRLVVAPAN